MTKIYKAQLPRGPSGEKDPNDLAQSGNVHLIHEAVAASQQKAPSEPAPAGRHKFLDTEERVAPETSVINLEPGSLLAKGKSGELYRKIDSLAAETVAHALRKKLAWDHEAGAWLLWVGSHWEPQEIAAKADRLIADCVRTGTDPIGYRVAYLNGVTSVIQRGGLLEPPKPEDGLIPFRNGLLCQKTRTLTPSTPERAMTWSLPHDFVAEANCPTIKTWLLRSVEGDGATVELLRAWLAALVRGIHLQNFLVLKGRGGSGKGTFQRLAMALVGSRNTAISTLRDLEESRFELAKLFGRRLCMVSEAGHHGGGLNMLKAITGGDPLPLERKHVQSSGSFTFGGLVLMATNEDIRSTDLTSGLERRRVTVAFPCTATAAERADWASRGGEAGVLHQELPGLIRWLLDMPSDEIRARFEAPPSRVVAANLLGMSAGNSVADWLLQRTAPDPDGWAQVGVKEERRTADNGVFYENAEDRLYPNYLAWCLEQGRSYPVALKSFSATLLDMAEQLGHPVVRDQHPTLRCARILGLRLLKDDEFSAKGCAWVSEGPDVVPKGCEGNSKGCEGIPEGQEASLRRDRRDEGQNFSCTFQTEAGEDW